MSGKQPPESPSRTLPKGFRALRELDLDVPADNAIRLVEENGYKVRDALRIVGLDHECPTILVPCPIHAACAASNFLKRPFGNAQAMRSSRLARALLLTAALVRPAAPTTPLTSPRRVSPTRRGHRTAGSGAVPPAPFPAFVVTPTARGRERGRESVLCERNDAIRLMAGNVDVVDASASADVAAANGERDDREERRLRFAGVGRLYAGKDPSTTSDIVLDRLASATVAVVGVGGVGSWAAESLCRSGVGNLVIVDLDDICFSNTNRQLHATASAVGRMKVGEMRTRLLDINPNCNVTVIYDFVTEENAHALVGEWSEGGLTACIDAIDGLREKAALILACVDRRVPIVTCGGTAGRTDPSQIVVDDLTKVQEDRLLFKCRKMLGQE